MDDSNDNKWFAKLRVNSWEIEILIVACILAALFNLPEFTTDKLNALYVSTHMDYRGVSSDAFNTSTLWVLVGLVKTFMYLAVNVFLTISKITFSLYIFFRGFWVAVIGLSSVFPKGIDLKNLRFTTYFNKLLPGTSFNSYILRIDNICSSIFSLGFLTAFFYVSILIYTAVIISSVGLIELSSRYLLDLVKLSYPYDLTSFLFIVSTVLGVVFFLDIIFLGILKRIKWKIFSYPYSKIYKAFRIITCFFLYESIYYLFVSNVKRRVILICWAFFLVFIGVSIISNKGKGYLKFPLKDFAVTKSFMSEFTYEDRLLASSDNFSFTRYPFINSEIISESYLKLHIPFHPYIHSSLDSACSITIQSLEDDANIAEHELLLDCINNVYAIYIDNDTIVNDFVFYTYTAGDVYINTFFMPISVSKYQEGKHVITIEKLFFEEIFDKKAGRGVIFADSTDYILAKGLDSLVHIPFYIYR